MTIEREPPTVAELDVIRPIERRIMDILTSYAFHGTAPKRCITVPPKDAEVIRANVARGNLKPDAVKTSAPGFVCSLAGVWILEAKS